MLDRRIPLEMCLLSNLHTGACERIEEHPFGELFRKGFRVCLNTDDRLMSNTFMTQETTLATDLFHLSLDDLEKLSLNAIKSAFAPFEKRIQIIYSIIKPSFDQARSALASDI